MFDYRYLDSMSIPCFCNDFTDACRCEKLLYLFLCQGKKKTSHQAVNNEHCLRPPYIRLSLALTLYDLIYIIQFNSLKQVMLSILYIIMFLSWQPTQMKFIVAKKERCKVSLQSSSKSQTVW